MNLGKKLWPEITESDIEAVVTQLKIGELSSAGKIDIINSLEGKFCNLTNCKYAIAMSSGTAAIHSALFALGIKEGDEVIVPSYAYHAVAAPVIAMNAIPVFADVDDTYAHINSASIEHCITKRTKAIILVHNYGFAVDLDPIIDLAKNNNIKIIEDCSHAHGSMYKDNAVGGFGDIGIFSLQAAKLVPAGEGGVFVTSDESLYEKALLLGHHYERTFLDVKNEFLRNYINTGFGLKYRINPLGAALANSQFDRLDSTILKRNEIYNYITKKLKKLTAIQPITSKSYMTRSTYYSYRFKFTSAKPNEIDLFLQKIIEAGIDVSKPSALPLFEENLFSKQYDVGAIRHDALQFNFDNFSQFDGVKKYRQSVFRIPSHYVDINQVDDMIDILLKCYEKIT